VERPGDHLALLDGVAPARAAAQQRGQIPVELGVVAAEALVRRAHHVVVQDRAAEAREPPGALSGDQPRGREHAQVGGQQLLVDRTQAPGQLLRAGRALAERVEQAQVERGGDQLQSNAGQPLPRGTQPSKGVPATKHLGQHPRAEHP
jgi:hypothetical protein